MYYIIILEELYIFYSIKSHLLPVITGLSGVDFYGYAPM